MTRSIAAVVTVALFAVLAPAAQAAPKSCTRGGGQLLAADGGVRVVAVKEKPRNAETRRERIYGCRASTGRRFTLFQARDFGLDSVERDEFEIIDGRYIGAIREFEGGISVARSAATWDVFKSKVAHTTRPCDDVSAGDFSGVTDLVFFRNGGIAYACAGKSRIVDGKGDRQLEPDGTTVMNLAVATNSRWFGPILYYTVDETTPKALPL